MRTVLVYEFQVFLLWFGWNYHLVTSFRSENVTRGKRDVDEQVFLKYGDNEPCDQDANCRFSGQICRDGFCVCPRGMFFVDRLTACYNRVFTQSDDCEINDQCANFAKLSICEYHTCKCPPSYRMQATPYPHCIYQEDGFDQKCSGDENCLIPGQRCVRNMCVCYPGTFFIPGRGECFNKINQEMDVCKVDEQCEPFATGSKCISSYCRCPDDYMMQTTPQQACVRAKSGYHELCFGNMQCGHRNQLCFHGLCYRMLTNINDPCDVTDQCEHYAPGSRCIAGYCSCLDHLKLRTIPTPLCVLNGSKRSCPTVEGLILMSAIILLVRSKFLIF